MKQLFAACTTIFAGAILFGSVAGCRVLDPAEDIPSYIHIDSISLSVTNTNVFGSATSDITDAWIFMDGKLIGAYELPCTVPILAEGPHSFSIRGGVRMNGLSSTRAIYTSWKNWESTVTLVRGEKATVAPVVTYYPAVVIPWHCNFEGVGATFTNDPSAGAKLTRDTFPNIDVYEGQYSGIVRINNSDSAIFWGYSSGGGYILPANEETWLEFDYKSNVPFTVGIVQANNHINAVPWLVVQPNAEWTKIYIRLNDPIAEAHQVFGGANTPSVSPYEIYFAANTSSNGKIYFDNIKLLK
jgi:hypothetical protein